MLETRASLNYLLDGGLETCVGVHSACFEVLNLYAGVSESDSGFEEIRREPMYEGSLHISLYPDSDRETPAHRFSTSKHAERTPRHVSRPPSNR